MKITRKIFVQHKKDILTHVKEVAKRQIKKIGAVRTRFARTPFINSQSIRWLEPLTLLALFSLLLALVRLMLS